MEFDRISGQAEQLAAESQAWARVMRLSDRDFVAALPDLSPATEGEVALSRLVLMADPALWPQVESLLSNREISGRTRAVAGALGAESGTLRVDAPFYCNLREWALQRLDATHGSPALVDIALRTTPPHMVQSLLERYMHDHQKLALILRRVVDSGATVDSKVILKLLGEVESTPASEADGILLTHLLECLRPSDPGGARERAFDLLRSDNISRSSATRLAKVICQSYGLDNIERDLVSTGHRVRRAGAVGTSESDSARQLALWELDMHVNDGGFRSYFGNDHGNELLLATDMARVIGDKGTVKLLERLRDLLLGLEPTGDFSFERIGVHREALQEPLRECDSEYSYCGTRVIARLILHAAGEKLGIDLLIRLRTGQGH